MKITRGSSRTVCLLLALAVCSEWSCARAVQKSAQLAGLQLVSSSEHAQSAPHLRDAPLGRVLDAGDSRSSDELEPLTASSASSSSAGADVASTPTPAPTQPAAIESPSNPTPYPTWMYNTPVTPSPSDAAPALPTPAPTTPESVATPPPTEATTTTATKAPSDATGASGSTTSTKATKSSASNGLSVGAIVGIVIGCVAAVGAIVGSVVVYKQRSGATDRALLDATHHGESDSPYAAM